MDAGRLHDELELYFNAMVPPVMQRGQVDGQDVPAVSASIHSFA